MARTNRTYEQSVAAGRHAASFTRKRKISDSEGLMAAALVRRMRNPVLLTGVKIAANVTLIQPSDFHRIGVDRDAYQRDQNNSDINSLITVLKSGGQIPDPIDIAERPDGSWWVVEGQQRFLAHEAVGVPLKAMIHQVPDGEAEAKLFVVLNSKRRLMPRTIIKGWQGAFGDFIRKVNTSDKSPLRGMIDMTHNSKLPLDAMTILKATVAVTTGIYPQGDTATSLLPRADVALKVPGATVWAEAFMQLLAAVFASQGAGGRVRVLPVVALGRVAHRRYKAAGRPVFPTSTARLRAINWDTIVPSHSQKYLALIEDRIERNWK